MRPTLAEANLRGNITQYLTTTFALDDEATRTALEHFFTDPERGIFRGPFLRINTPFQEADDGWRAHLEWVPAGFRPHWHQARAWERLSTLTGPAQPTLITTGTGSGKTESFLYPVLDHCARRRRVGVAGMKAILLYPMNALATDQAGRLDALLADPALSEVTAGLYIGDTPDTKFNRVLVRHGEIRQARPDILITNYKMLDQLLQREADVGLWQESDLAYVVVDEFHTYDGAQGTDVAMLLRRLGAAVDAARPGAPLGDICPVATSATLGGAGVSGGRLATGSPPRQATMGEAGSGATSLDTMAGGNDALRRVAWEMFGVEFTADSVIGERRLAVDDFVEDLSLSLPLPTPQELAAVADPAHDPDALAEIARLVLGEAVTDPQVLGRRLRQHILTIAVLGALSDGPASYPEVLALMPRHGAYVWGAALRTHPEAAATALARFVALLSTARDPLRPDRPLVTVEAHLWVRAVSRLLRQVHPRPRFLWHGDRPELESGGNTVPGEGAGGSARWLGDHLPAVYCRHCGRSGWMAISRETDPADLDAGAERIYRASFSNDRRRRRALIAATLAEARSTAPQDAEPTRQARSTSKASSRVFVLEPTADRVRPLRTGETEAGSDAVFVLADLRREAAADEAAENDRCPACGIDNGIRFLGSGVAPLASVAVTELFTGGELPEQEQKTVIFSDSLQDAAHRAGYVADRSFTFSLRALLVERLREDTPTRLNDLISDVIAASTHLKTLGAVVPPDLHELPGVPRLLAGVPNVSRGTWRLVAERLAFAAVTEFGLRSRQGRTLELTRTVAVDVPIDAPERVLDLVQDIHRRLPGQLTIGDTAPDRRAFGTFLTGLLQRLRTSGAIKHHWLDAYLHNGGARRWLVWGGRPQGMPAFPRGVSAPSFLLGRQRRRSQFDFAGSSHGWLADWATRSLYLPRATGPAFFDQLLPALAAEGVLARHLAEADIAVYGLLPGHLEVQLLPDDAVAAAVAVCDACHRHQPLFPGREDRWLDGRCPRFRCLGTLRAVSEEASDGGQPARGRDFQRDYYRNLYRNAGPYQVVAAEHTSMLGRQKREQTERGFRNRAGYSDPNVLSATPTLELGIDIGDLSAVILASVPRRPANYVQRAGRAGRRTGNSLLVTFASRTPHDLYYLRDPLQMIAGSIIPPGAYLSAVEILRRQYAAHLIDLAARGLLPGVAPLPRLSVALFGNTGWLHDLAQAAEENGAELVEGFLALFPPDPGGDPTEDREARDRAHDLLREFAVAGIVGRIERITGRHSARLDELKGRVKAIDEALVQLRLGGDRSPTVDDDGTTERRVHRELTAERRAVYARISELRAADAHGTLVELGLLPNYSLLDGTVALDATLLGRTRTDSRSGDRDGAAGTGDGEDGEVRSETELRSYERPSAYALTELAPGNTYYVDGYKHVITGVETSRRGGQEWQTWRLCPDCGHVRTHDARADTSRCPRCRSAAIADTGCLHRVLAPSRVTARSRREDARISDDAEDRERMAYETATSVDIDVADIARGAWRREGATFGVDFASRAVIRRFNLGRRRFDIQPSGRIAGEDVRISGFGVCEECGYATAMDPQTYAPPGADATASVSLSASPHRPWCSRWRAMAPLKERLLLVHPLETEAIRILLPAVTIRVDERRASLSAALTAGIAKVYRGDPQHLRITPASMPDQETGERRRFLVIYDRLPSGTGYLHRLASPESFHRVLSEARRLIRDCPCREDLPACHRCLLGHAPPEDHDLVSRAEALRIIDAVLGSGDFETREITSASEISLVKQVDSELEHQFLAGLITWCADPTTPGSLGPAVAVDGRLVRDLRIDARDGSEVIHWAVVQQHNLRDQIPDVTFTRVDGPRSRVSVYLDGFRWHAGEHNRVAADARKRMRLRADGDIVFQLTWTDVTSWQSSRSAAKDSSWLPYLGAAQQTAHQASRRRGAGGSDLDETVFVNPVAMLLAYLGEPDRDRWRLRAQAVLEGLLAHEPRRRELIFTESAGLPAALTSALTGGPLPAAADGQIVLLRNTDVTGCLLVVLIDRRAPTAVFTGFTVLDDGEDLPQLRPRWQAWLRWGDLLQFLPGSGGPGGVAGEGVQLAASTAAEFDPTLPAVAGGTGVYLALLADEDPSGVGDPIPGLDDLLAPASTTSGARTAASGDGGQVEFDDSDLDEEWRAALGELDAEQPVLVALARAAAAAGVRAPLVGYELGTAGWLAELAWPDGKVAVIVDIPAHPAGQEEQDRRDEAFHRAGWEARRAEDWTVAGLVRRLVTAKGEQT
ncbi:DEAD/DEAH box helicase [Actinoalloteichus sp. GBA129-24]|uniref:DEAD/DEAH box helicase n=1 Tax=Actinoalloteichus sp. GBA129-24 TaxID=1612551 RepID=UPI000950A09A|nr:DEAD/DEAH box helicase [Actinoalloteichus sp. GBA129-24]APU22558.1 helicase family protein,protein of unknown function (DUF1998) [Actinoalloteichus sp. GBA129-24]